MQCFITRWNTEKRVENVRRAAEYSWWTLRYCFIYWWNIVSNAWYYFSNKKILDREIKNVKLSSFSSDYQTLPIYFLAPATQAIDFNFLCIFFTNYRWVWEQGFNKALCSMTLRANHFPINFYLLELGQTSWAGTDVGFLYLSPSHQWYSYLQIKSISDNISMKMHYFPYPN